MASGEFRFDRFVLAPDNRRLTRDGTPVELNARYFDALALLVSAPGVLISKDRFLDEVWKGVPVTDEALTQCVKTLRRQLGDDAARPRFIETVPKHGYRFVAAVESVLGANEVGARPTPVPTRLPGDHGWRNVFLLGAAGTIGAGVAGLIGGLVYGFASAAQPLQPGMGAASVLIVLMCVTILIALLGGAGVAFGIAAAGFARANRWLWTIVGGASGGLVVGAVVKLLGLDAFNLLLGRSPGDVTGAAEGVALGAAVGFGAWLGQRSADALRGASVAGLVGGAAGIVITLLGGRLMAGSLDLLVRQFPESRFRFAQVGRLFGEDGLGRTGQIVTGGLEGALFAGCIVGAMIVARRQLQGMFRGNGIP